MLYEKFEKHWKIWLWIPFVILAISSCVLVSNILTTGSFMQRDVELSGGKVITIQVDSVDINHLKQTFPYANIHVTSGIIKNVLIEIPFDMDENVVIDELKNVVDIKGEPTTRTIGPALGDIFFEQAQIALIGAFILMSIFVFILFRSFVPSSLVILAAVTDIVSAVAITSFMGIQLSLPVLVALLTLIGYSVDTNILLTSELLKTHEGDVSKKIKQAMKTGLTLTITILVALFAMFFVSGSFILEQISIVLIVGLIIDMPVTWLTNSGLLRFWLERKGGHNAEKH